MYLNAFIGTLLTGAVLSLLAMKAQYYFYYLPVDRYVAIITLLSIFAGNLAGRLIFTFIPSRISYIFTEILFVIITLVILYRNTIFPGPGEPLVELYGLASWLPALILAGIPFLSGIRIHYFMKVASGDFLDEFRVLIPMGALTLSGLLVGIVVPLLINNPELTSRYLPIILVFMVPGIFLIHYRYTPVPFMTESEDTDTSRTEKSDLSEHTRYIFLNIAYILIYSYLLHLAFTRFYGIRKEIIILFLVVTLAAIVIGYAAGKYIKRMNWHIYGSIFFPPLVVYAIILLYQIKGSGSPVTVALLFIPAGLFFGFTLNHSLHLVMEKFTHSERFNILDISVLILPPVLLSALALVQFTDLWYYIILYSTIGVNLLLPVLHITTLKKQYIKKLILFVYTIALIPLFIFNHIYLEVPIKGEAFITNVDNYEAVAETNYNNLFIRDNERVIYNGYTIFHLSNTIIKNLKRAVAPVALYCDPASEDILFIDGNQRFFRNPLYSYFDIITVLDPLDDHNVDYRTLPVSGQKLYVADNKPVLSFLSRNRDTYRAIVSVPNIVDLTVNPYRVSKEYYRLVKRNLDPDGIHAQILNLHDASSALMLQMLDSLESLFSHHRMYFFSNILMIISTDRQENLLLSAEKTDRLHKMINRPLYETLYYNEYHVLSHYISGDLESIRSLLPQMKHPGILVREQDINTGRYMSSAWLDFIEMTDAILDSLPEDDPSFSANFRQEFKNQEDVLRLLQVSDYSEAHDRYNLEKKNIQKLRELAQYRVDLRDYIRKIFDYKIRYYSEAASDFEQQKKWERARELYQSILSMAPGNFDAHYRLGIISITLQDLDQAFEHLSRAQELQPTNGKVLYQLGVLNFSTGRYDKAITFLENALEKREATLPLYLYLGLSYERENNLSKAEEYLRKAVILDPNDKAIAQQLQRVREAIEAEENRWKMPEQKNEMEAEENMNIPLPINKSAYDIRLKDDEEAPEKDNDK
jgi:tetratricopeptide (TPR) repeat protein